MALELEANDYPKLPIVEMFNNPIKIFLKVQALLLSDIYFIKYLWISKILLVSIALQKTEKIFILLFNHVFFILLSVKSFEILPRYNRYGFISGSFDLK